MGRRLLLKRLLNPIFDVEQLETRYQRISDFRKLGVKEPVTLEDWATMPLGANVLPWLRGRDLDRLNRMLAYFLLLNQVSRKHSA